MWTPAQQQVTSLNNTIPQTLPPLPQLRQVLGQYGNSTTQNNLYMENSTSTSSNRYQSYNYSTINSYDMNSTLVADSTPSFYHQHLIQSDQDHFGSSVGQYGENYPMVRRLLDKAVALREDRCTGAVSPNKTARSVGTSVSTYQCVGGAQLHKQLLSTGTQTEPSNSWAQALASAMTQSTMSSDKPPTRQQIYGWQMHRAIMAYQSFVKEMRQKLDTWRGVSTTMTLLEEQAVDNKLRNLVSCIMYVV